MIISLEQKLQNKKIDDELEADNLKNIISLCDEALKSVDKASDLLQDLLSKNPIYSIYCDSMSTYYDCKQEISCFRATVKNKLFKENPSLLKYKHALENSFVNLENALKVNDDDDRRT